MSAGPLRWERDESVNHRALVELDAWQVRVHTGYHPLSGYPNQVAVTHADWQASRARAEALHVLGEELMVEIDDAVIGAPRHAGLRAERTRDAALAEAWRRVPAVTGLDFDRSPSFRAEHGTPFVLDGLVFQWATGSVSRGLFGHRAMFPRGPVELHALSEVLHHAGHFVFFLGAERVPSLFTDAGERCSGLEQQTEQLSLAESVVVFGGGAPSDGRDDLAPLRLRLSSRAHPLGEARAVTGEHFVVAVDPRRGIVARS